MANEETQDKGGDPSSKAKQCSFCLKVQAELRMLVQAPNGAGICDECVKLTADVMNEELRASAPPTGMDRGGNFIQPKKPIAASTEAEQHYDKLLAERRREGRKTYGRGLTHTDNYDWNRMAMEEALDMSQYLAAENLRLQQERDDIWKATRLEQQARGYGLSLAQAVERVRADRDDLRVRLKNEEARANDLHRICNDLIPAAERWRTLLRCQRIRVVGSANLGQPDQHLALEFWGRYTFAPGELPSTDGRRQLTIFTDALRPRPENKKPMPVPPPVSIKCYHAPEEHDSTDGCKVCRAKGLPLCTPETCSAMKYVVERDAKLLAAEKQWVEGMEQSDARARGHSPLLETLSPPAPTLEMPKPDHFASAAQIMLRKNVQEATIIGLVEGPISVGPMKEYKFGALFSATARKSYEEINAKLAELEKLHGVPFEATPKGEPRREGDNYVVDWEITPKLPRTEPTSCTDDSCCSQPAMMAPEPVNHATDCPIHNGAPCAAPCPMFVPEVFF